ncbi:CPBP family intramembrane metalloprotease [Halostella sp. JP-L12]|uniref:CPBP family intramembrane glutamic endopeptidase n=1 Tax=Halostella TaxID=1843185 RepID=UPI0013CEF524|nr:MULTISPECIES: type II CAAX endopeptidase family protein [Halostella]NHN46587.1 CPBP family intramembrane metalloprotease [Halostella sp. JP-L12]
MTENQIVFRGGRRTVLGFAVAFAVVTAIWVPLTAAVADQSAWIKLATEISKFAVILGFVAVLLRSDTVRFAELGLSRQHLLAALIVFGGFWIAMNLLGVGLAVVTDNQWALQLLWSLPESDPTFQRYASLPATSLLLILLNFLVIGLVEEIAFRGYFQSKIIALLGDSTRRHIALGIGVTSLVFGVLHTPAAVVDGQSLDGILAAALAPTVTAVLFGAFYELTHNVYFVALLHGFGNTWPLVVDWTNWSGTALIAFWVCAAGIYLATTFAYRYWLAAREQVPLRTRDDDGHALRG